MRQVNVSRSGSGGQNPYSLGFARQADLGAKYFTCTCMVVYSALCLETPPERRGGA